MTGECTDCRSARKSSLCQRVRAVYCMNILKPLSDSLRCKARRFGVRVSIRAVGILALDSTMPWIVLLVERPFSKPYFFFRLCNHQIFNNNVLHGERLVPLDDSRRNDGIPNFDISQSDIFHSNASGNRTMLFDGPG